jgi:hypothetical protein
MGYAFHHTYLKAPVISHSDNRRYCFFTVLSFLSGRLYLKKRAAFKKYYNIVIFFYTQTSCCVKQSQVVGLTVREEIKFLVTFSCFG